MRPHTSSTRRFCAAAVIAGFAALAAAPVVAQTVDEITVMGRMGPDGRPAQLSRVITISDLDLGSDAGVSALRVRVRDTARDLCRQLGETGGGSGLLRSCEDEAVTRAMNDARPIIAARRSGATYAFAAPPPAPYVAPVGEPAASAEEVSTPASAEVPAAVYTTTTITNGPVPDTPENRARFGGPLSNAGQRTAPAGN